MLIVSIVKEYSWIYPYHHVMPLISSIGYCKDIHNRSVLKHMKSFFPSILASLVILSESYWAEMISAANNQDPVSSWWLFKSYCPKSASCHRQITAMPDWRLWDKNPSLIHTISLSLSVRISLSLWRNNWLKPNVNWLCIRSMDPRPLQYIYININPFSKSRYMKCENYVT